MSILNSINARCLAEETAVQIIVDNNVITVDMETLHDLFENGKNILIKSHHEWHDTLYTRVAKVWKSGVKNVYKIRTENGNAIRATKEHLFFIEGKGYIPLSDIKPGDTLITLNNNSEIELDNVVSAREDGKCETYDAEVPETENFFANNIKTHNSRWFH